MSQNGQRHFKNLAAIAAKIFKVSDYFGTLCIKGLSKVTVYFLHPMIR